MVTRDETLPEGVKGYIDEISVLLVPIVDGSWARSLFEGAHPKDFKIKDVQKSLDIK